MNENMVIHLSDEAHRKLEVSIKKALKHGLPMTLLINSGNVEDNNQNRTAGTERAKERKELSLKEKNALLVQIINVQNKDSEIRLLWKILADNRIEV